MDQVTTPDIAADRRATLFVFPSSAEPVLGSTRARQVDGMDDTTATVTATATTTELPETSELRATFLLFALVLLIPALFGMALLGMR